MFVIKIIDKVPQLVKNLPVAVGAIKIGSFEEKFNVCLKWWLCEDYEKQWAEGLERLYNHKVSCLVASVQLVPKNPLINRWILYLEDETVFVQNHMIFHHIFEETYDHQQFTLETCYNYIAPRRTTDKDGHKLLEWSFKLQDLSH